MPKISFSRDYLPMVVWAGIVAVLLLGFAFFPKSADWYGCRRLREREVGYARRLHYFGLEILELLGRVTASLTHLRASDRHRYQRNLEDFLHRLFESHKQDLNDDRILIIHELRKVAHMLIDELESGRSDRAVMVELDKRLQKLGHRTQLNSVQAERS